MHTRPTTSSLDRRTIVEVVRGRYPAVAVNLLNPLAELLRVTRLCTGDVETFLVLLAIGIRTAADERFRALPADRVAKGEVAPLPTRGTNIRSVADSLRMPRETVRRKTVELIEAGWVERRGGQLVPAPKVFPDLQPVTQAILELAAAQYLAVAALLAEEADGGGREHGRQAAVVNRSAGPRG